jgi:acetyl esterase/lipase
LSEIDAIRALLSSKPRPIGWAERRQRLDEVGSVWTTADDIRLESIDIGMLAAESSIAPGSDPSRVPLYFHGGGYCTDPMISPLFSELRGFPPTLIQVGSAETLLDDATRLASALGAADVPVTLEVWPHMIHAWPLWNAKLEDGRKALVRAGEFMKRWLA